MTEWSPLKRYFNPRSREGSDTVWVPSMWTPPISILAPARGATINKLVKIHAKLNFNPRSREGSDKLLDYFNKTLQISILAPARGATGSDC